MSGLDLDAIDAAATLIADREAFADDGAIYAYTGEKCHRLGSGESSGSDYALGAAFMELAAAWPAASAEIRRLRSDLAAARAEADGLRGLAGEACDLYGVLFARYNTLRASAGLALDGGDGKIVAIRARAGKTGGR